ncbi:MAG: DUF4136 domain-containing protein [Lysobacterales bacterium]
MQNTSVSKSTFNWSWLAAILMLLAGCASGPAIETDYDHTVDFSQYKTYAFFNPMGIENPNYSSIYGSIFRDAISKEMESRGYRLSDNPDLLINVSGRLQDKTKVTTSSNPYMAGGYYGYRRGAYGAWGGYGYGTTTNISNYTEGTVNVDIVDRAAKRMVWEGVAIGRVHENRTNEEKRENIFAGIQEMFAAYPFRAAR